MNESMDQTACCTDTNLLVILNVRTGFNVDYTHD